MYLKWRLCLVLIGFIVLPGYPTRVFKLEAEDVLRSKDGHTLMVKRRPGSSSGKVVMLQKWTTVYFYLCFSTRTRFDIEGVRLRNVKAPFQLSIALQNETMYRIRQRKDSKSTYYRRKSRRFIIEKQTKINLKEFGKYRLDLNIYNAPTKDLELDYVTIRINNNQTIDEVLCKVFCKDSFKYKRKTLANNGRSYLNRRNIPVALKRSYTTQCAEEDNINIPIVVQKFRHVRITATHPRYSTYTNTRTPDFTHCAMVSSLWTFQNIVFESDLRPGEQYNKASLGRKHTKHVHGDVAALITGVNARDIMVDIRFQVQGQSAGVVDADIGSRLIVRLKGLYNHTEIGIKYKGRRDKWIWGEIRAFSNIMTELVWDIPDFTWTENGPNFIHIEIHYPRRSLYRFVEIEKIELDRRYKRPTEFFHMHNDGKYLVEGADIDFWWLVNQSMSVNILETGQIFHRVHYFRIYSRIPWSKDRFSQIFVLYQDGYTRILPVSPHGVDWIPFGSSILIGQSNVDSARPSAPIHHVDIAMHDLKVYIYYRDGGFIDLQIEPKLLSTVLNIQNANHFKYSNKTAFLTYRSMWVTNGNADVDHVTVDGTTHHILDERWSTLRGFYFVFFRRCISKHNSLSPDIEIEFLDERK